MDTNCLEICCTDPFISWLYNCTFRMSASLFPRMGRAISLHTYTDTHRRNFGGGGQGLGKCPLPILFLPKNVYSVKNLGMWGGSGRNGFVSIKDWFILLFPVFLSWLHRKLKFQIPTVDPPPPQLLLAKLTPMQTLPCLRSSCVPKGPAQVGSEYAYVYVLHFQNCSHLFSRYRPKDCRLRRLVL
jgi:hypothetical protein